MSFDFLGRNLSNFQFSNQFGGMLTTFSAVQANKPALEAILDSFYENKDYESLKNLWITDKKFAKICARPDYRKKINFLKYRLHSRISGSRNYGLAILNNGTIIQINYPNKSLTSIGLQNNIKFISVGHFEWQDSQIGYGLLANGALMSWQLSDPSTIRKISPDNLILISFSVGWNFLLGLLDDGTAIYMSGPNDAQIIQPPTNKKFMAVSAGGSFDESMYLLDDGTVQGQDPERNIGLQNGQKIIKIEVESLGRFIALLENGTPFNLDESCSHSYNELPRNKLIDFESYNLKTLFLYNNGQVFIDDCDFPKLLPISDIKEIGRNSFGFDTEHYLTLGKNNILNIFTLEDFSTDDIEVFLKFQVDLSSNSPTIRSYSS